MTTRDLKTECTALFNRYSCPILISAATILFGVFCWYATRIETKTEAMQSSLQQIEVKVGILIDRQPNRPASPGTVAGVNNE